MRILILMVAVLFAAVGCDDDEIDEDGDTVDREEAGAAIASEPEEGDAVDSEAIDDAPEAATNRDGSGGCPGAASAPGDADSAAIISKSMLCNDISLETISVEHAVGDIDWDDIELDEVLVNDPPTGPLRKDGNERIDGDTLEE